MDLQHNMLISIITTILITLCLEIFIIYRFKSQEVLAMKMWQLFLAGIALSIAILFLQKLINPIILNGKGENSSLIYSSFITSSLLEETGKIVALLIFLALTTTRYELKSLLLYTFSLAWGFCFFENLRYGFTYELGTLMRFKMATPMHIIATLFAALFIFKYTNASGRKRDLWALLIFLVPILVHGFYNLLLQMPNPTPLNFGFTFAAMEVIILYIVFFFIYKKEEEK